MSTINRRAALSALAAAIPASLAAKAEETKPFIIPPPPPAPAGAPEELLRAIRFEYESELAQFGYQLEGARAVYADYPDLVKSDHWPQPVVDAMFAENHREPVDHLFDAFMRPSEILANAEDWLQASKEENERRRAAKAEAEQRAAEKAERDAEANEDHARRMEEGCTTQEDLELCRRYLHLAWMTVAHLGHLEPLRLGLEKGTEPGRFSINAAALRRFTEAMKEPVIVDAEYPNSWNSPDSPDQEEPANAPA